MKLRKDEYLAAYTYTRAVNERMTDVIIYVSKMVKQELEWFKESFETADFPKLLEEIMKK
ncbi:MAG: hypothetical protein B7Y11_12800 [Sphingobacteriia bacterium 24-36-13]|jgi:hypothetical protein|uniref:hypothetical protein n=1 Tax=Sediminibacterium sp. TaxID=1917865 RepID=UPI000BCDCF2C|nr:hypothetical protein [Sediminibacterium sp.]OYZ52000.1 MAG: hypothetical protein B7Y11_12800 [Sphingobacteriia bacterium 24-36-13]OZA65030.1 MAG: hypothetical protein B7X68_05190 [Sphingobacteriia bacterium 39-36-14]HQS35843.1 hypothetical protein [Sediminibacterium sp.]